MKKITLIALSFGLMLSSFAQDKINISFTAVEQATVQLGVKWDYQYKPMRSPIKVTFDGSTLNMVFPSGKVYSTKKVISYTTTKETDKEYYILKVLYDGFINYITIIISEEAFAKCTEIKMPFFYKNGVVMSYTYFQSKPTS